jgi:hypothetical protein
MFVDTSFEQDHLSKSARLLRRGLGIGAAAALMTAGGASAATTVHRSAGGTFVYGVAASRAPYSYVKASPLKLTPGQRVTLTGNAPRNAHTGAWISLESDAFLSKVTTDGIPTIRTQVLVNGKYKTTAVIKPGLKPTNYAIMGMYAGKPLDTVAWITIRPDSSVTASPRFATAGQRIKITGNAPRNAHAGEWVTVKSHAFSSRFTSDGIPSLRAQILVNGTYEVTATLRRGLAPRTYTVLGSYKGEPLDTDARIGIR